MPFRYRTIHKAFTFCIAICSITAVCGYSQNLVRNGGFEEITACPGLYAQSVAELRVSHWTTAGLGTPDYFHACSEGEADVPYNWAGVSDAFEGSGYGGLFLWMNDDKDYREYFQTMLQFPLVKDSSYSITFRYKLSSYSKYAVDRIGVLLTQQLPKIRHDKVLKIAPTFHIIQDSALTENTGTWELAQAEFKAKGGETMLILGNFFSNADTKRYKIISRPVSEPMLAEASYYYIDAVAVTPKYPAETMESPPVEPVTEVYTLNKNYVLENIQFELNSHKLMHESLSALAPVIAFMNSNPKVIVQISGHTDDQGSNSYNLALSQKRARSVLSYLHSRGIEKSRIQTFAYGKQKPLTTGRSEEDRKLNRRVEIKFISAFSH